MQELIYLRQRGVWAFNSHFFVTGQSGSGKSVAAEWRVIEYVNAKTHVVIDCGDRGRFENFCYALKEVDPALLNLLHMRTRGTIKAHTTPCELLLLCGQGLYTIDKLPNNVKLCSFKKEDMKIPYMYELLGETKNLMVVLQNLQAKYGRDFNLKDLEQLVFQKTFKGKKTYFSWGNSSTYNMMVNRLRAWLDSGLFSDHPDVVKIDFLKMFNQPGKVVCPNNYLLMPQEDEIAYSILLDNIFEMKRTRRIKYPIALYLRELSNFMEWKITKNIVKTLATQGRGYQIDLIACFQSPMQIQPPVIRQQAGYTLQLKASLAVAQKINDIQIVPSNVVNRIPYFKPGEGILVTGQKWLKNVMIPPSPHRHASKGFDVMEELGKAYGWRKVDGPTILNYGDDSWKPNYEETDKKAEEDKAGFEDI